MVFRVAPRALHKIAQVRFKTDKCGAKEKYTACTIAEGMIDPCKPEPAVVVVGAGIAGLSAAQRLIQCGFSKIKILEATDRPGGRIHSCWLGDAVVELGAAFIEGGCSANPIYNLACQEGLLKPPLHKNQPSKNVFLTSEGRAVNLPLSITAYHTFRLIQQEAASLFTLATAKKSHGSLLNFMSLRIQQELKNFPDSQKYDAARVMFGLTNTLRCRCGEDLSQVSADNFGSYIAIPGGRVPVPLGFVGVIAPLIRELPENALVFGKPVEKIEWNIRSSQARAMVHCCDGDKYPADFVLVTVPLGVLKKHMDKMFVPTLPAEKREAISQLGFGHKGKIFLEYSQPFWVWCEGGMNLAWSPEELSNRSDWTRGLCSVDELPGSKHVLCASVSGLDAVQMEHLTDEQVAEGVTRTLRQFTGDASLPYPATVLKSKWSKDPYFNGSYSFLAVSSNLGHQCDLALPLPSDCTIADPIVLFAGEATCVGHYSTVHGARLSGIREAERILQLTKKHGGPPVS